MRSPRSLSLPLPFLFPLPSSLTPLFPLIPPLRAWILIACSLWLLFSPTWLSWLLARPQHLGPPVHPGLLNIGVIGDWGVQRMPWEEEKEGRQEAQEIVAALMGSWSKKVHPKFIVSVGDHAYPRGLKGSNETARLKRGWKDVYTEGELRHAPWYLTPGNHDCVGDVQAEYAYSEEETRWKMRPFQAVRAALPGSMHNSSLLLVLLDMCTWVCGKAGEPNFRCLASEKDGMPAVKHMGSARREEMISWLGATLKDQCGMRGGGRTWCIVAGHWPVFSFSGNGPTDILIEELLPLLKAHRVHAYLSGHDHNMQHIRLKENSLPHFFVNGAGGYDLHPTLKENVEKKVRETQESMADLVKVVVSHGFLAVALDDDHMHVTMLGVSQKRISDSLSDHIVYEHSISL